MAAEVTDMLVFEIVKYALLFRGPKLAVNTTSPSSYADTNAVRSSLLPLSRLTSATVTLELSNLMDLLSVTVTEVELPSA